MEVKEASGLTFSPATVADLDLLLNHFEQARVASTGAGFTAAERAFHRENFEYMLTDRRFGTLIIKDGSEVIATMLYETMPEPITVTQHHLHAESPQDLTSEEAMLLVANFEPSISRVHISSMTVIPHKRSQGVGNQVMEMFEASVSSRCDVISFQTGKDNVAMQKLAEKCGFTLVEVEDDKLEGYGGQYMVAVKDIGKAMEKLAKNEIIRQRKKDEDERLQDLFAQVEGLN